jgi:hypothetical protein
MAKPSYRSATALIGLFLVAEGPSASAQGAPDPFLSVPAPAPRQAAPSGGAAGGTAAPSTRPATPEAQPPRTGGMSQPSSQPPQPRQTSGQDQRSRIQRAFHSGDLTALNGCWRAGSRLPQNWTQELCFISSNAVTYSVDFRFGGDRGSYCSPWPNVFIVFSQRGSITIEAPQTQGSACAHQSGNRVVGADFPRTRLICRAHDNRADQIICEKSIFERNSNTPTSRDDFTFHR